MEGGIAQGDPGLMTHAHQEHEVVLAEDAFGLSYADISKVCVDAIKDAIINDKDKVTAQNLSNLFAERRKYIKTEHSSHSIS